MKPWHKALVTVGVAAISRFIEEWVRPQSGTEAANSVLELSPMKKPFNIKMPAIPARQELGVNVWLEMDTGAGHKVRVPTDLIVPGSAREVGHVALWGGDELAELRDAQGIGALDGVGARNAAFMLARAHVRSEPDGERAFLATLCDMCRKHPECTVRVREVTRWV